MAPRPEEIAVLVVNGQEFRDWTSVRVELRWNEPYSIFVFTCTEKQPSETVFSKLKFIPGDKVQIFLAGQLAITGWITVRQASNDATNHGVQLIGKTKTWDAARSEIKPEDANCDGFSWSAIARKFLTPLNINLRIIGEIDEKPFENCHAQPGRQVWSWLEELARNRKIHLGNDKFGNALAIGIHSAEEVGSAVIEGTRDPDPLKPITRFGDGLIEGHNILRANCVISDENVYAKLFAYIQRSGNDSINGVGSSEPKAERSGSSSRQANNVIMVEHPGGQDDAQRRVDFEWLITEGAQIEATITVQGWLQPSHISLWEPGTVVAVKSPMLLLDRHMAIRSAIYTQDDQGGTLTTLELVLPERLNTFLNFGVT